MSGISKMYSGEQASWMVLSWPLKEDTIVLPLSPTGLGGVALRDYRSVWQVTALEFQCR